MPGFLPDYDSNVLLGQGSGPFPGEYLPLNGFVLDRYLRLSFLQSGSDDSEVGHYESETFCDIMEDRKCECCQEKYGGSATNANKFDILVNFRYLMPSLVFLVWKFLIPFELVFYSFDINPHLSGGV